jgi:hypothetical protein
VIAVEETRGVVEGWVVDSLEVRGVVVVIEAAVERGATEVEVVGIA